MYQTRHSGHSTTGVRHGEVHLGDRLTTNGQMTK